MYHSSVVPPNTTSITTLRMSVRAVGSSIPGVCDPQWRSARANSWSSIPTPGISKCKSQMAGALLIEVSIANEWCEYLGQGFSTKTTTRLWTVKDWWEADISTIPKEWGYASQDYTFHLRWKPKDGKACQDEQWPGFYKDVCVNTCMAFDSKNCK